MAELTYHQRWYLANKDRLDAQHRDYYHANKEKRTAKIREWREKNKEKVRQLCKNWREENKAHHSKQKSDWKKKNKRKVVLYAERRRSLDVNARLLTEENIQRVYEDNIKKYGTLTCVLCKETIVFGQDSLEHLTPLSRGGTNEYENLAVAHLKCNSAKGRKTMAEWKEYLAWAF